MTVPNIVAKWQSWAPQLQGLLRIVAALMFMLAGTMKLFAFPAGIPPDGGTVPLMSQMGLGAILEVGGGLLLLGLFTRPVAILLSGEMAVAYFQFHFLRASGRTSTVACPPCSTAFSGSISRPPAPGRGAWTPSGGSSSGTSST